MTLYTFATICFSIHGYISFLTSHCHKMLAHPFPNLSRLSTLSSLFRFQPNASPPLIAHLIRRTLMHQCRAAQIDQPIHPITPHTGNNHTFRAHILTRVPFTRLQHVLHLCAEQCKPMAQPLFRSGHVDGRPEQHRQQHNSHQHSRQQPNHVCRHI